ncbi:MAG: ribonuclease D [Flavobacteriales bacterium]
MKLFKYITEQFELEDLGSVLRNAEQAGVDLEFDKNRYAYGFNLSMVQLKISDNIYLIDALQVEDLSSVYKMLEDDSIEKIVFAFGEDIRLLHSLDCFPANIFDLSIAASMLNFPPCSLSSLTFKVLSVEEKESSQKSNWLKRPLTAAQLSYAAEDVEFLRELHDSLTETINNKGITDWVRQENKKYDLSDYSNIQSFSPLKNKDKKGLSEYQFYILEQLMNYREEIAERENKPGYHIVDKNVLIKLANGEMRLRDLFSMKGISKYFKNAEAKAMLHGVLANADSKSKNLDLSLTDPAIRKLSREDYLVMTQRKKVTDSIVQSILLPIKNAIKDDIGEFASSFMFSNKIMNEIASKGLSGLTPYKQKLIWDYATKLKIDLSEFTL